MKTLIAITILFMSCTKTNQTIINLPPTYEKWLGFVIKSDTLIRGTYCIKDFDNPRDTIIVQHSADTVYQNAFIRFTDSKPYIYKYFKTKIKQ